MVVRKPTGLKNGGWTSRVNNQGVFPPHRICSHLVDSSIPSKVKVVQQNLPEPIVISEVITSINGPKYMGFTWVISHLSI